MKALLMIVMIVLGFSNAHASELGFPVTDPCATNNSEKVEFINILKNDRDYMAKVISQKRNQGVGVAEIAFLEMRLANASKAIESCELANKLPM